MGAASGAFRFRGFGGLECCCCDCVGDPSCVCFGGGGSSMNSPDWGSNGGTYADGADRGADVITGGGAGGRLELNIQSAWFPWWLCPIRDSRFGTEWRKWNRIWSDGRTDVRLTTCCWHYRSQGRYRVPSVMNAPWCWCRRRRSRQWRLLNWVTSIEACLSWPSICHRPFNTACLSRFGKCQGV